MGLSLSPQRGGFGSSASIADEEPIQFEHEERSTPSKQDRNLADLLGGSTLPHSPPIEQNDQALTAFRCSASLSLLSCVETGSCNTVARWPTHRRFSRTILPSANSSASW